MPRPMRVAQFAKPDECPAGSHRPGDDDEAVLTVGGAILCAAHAATVTADRIAARGPYRQIRAAWRTQQKETSGAR
jgi:hypothetical protein